MKHAMAIKLLVAGACALGGAALAQPDNGTQAPGNPGGGTGMTNPGPAASSPGPAASDPGMPSRSMTRAQKKQSLESIKKAIHDAESPSSRAASQGGAASSAGANGRVQHLRVFRRGDMVILRGTVRTQDDKERFGNAAEGADAGEQVVNELQVK
jgi:hypothetical protein